MAAAALVAAATTRPGDGLGIASLVTPIIATSLIWTWVGNMNLLQSPSSSLGLIAVATLAITGAFAATDASRLGIGSEADVNSGGGRRSGPLAWFLFHLVLWVVAFPSYLYWRSRYGAKSFAGAAVVVMLIFVVSLLWMEFNIASASARLTQ